MVRSYILMADLFRPGHGMMASACRKGGCTDNEIRQYTCNTDFGKGSAKDNTPIFRAQGRWTFNTRRYDSNKSRNFEAAIASYDLSNQLSNFTIKLSVHYHLLKGLKEKGFF